MKLQAFNINGSGEVCFYLQDEMESVLVNIQDFTVNGCDWVCFSKHSGL